MAALSRPARHYGSPMERAGPKSKALWLDQAMEFGTRCDNGTLPQISP